MALRPALVARSVAALLIGATLAAASPADAAIVERIVAIVGDKPILLSELRGRAKPFLLQIQDKVPEGAQRAAAESQLFRELIEKVIEEELEAQAAQKAHLVVTAEEIDAAFRNIATAQKMTVAALFRDAKLRSGLSEQDYRDEIRRQILEGKMLQLRVKGRVRITDDDVRAMFDRSRKEELKRREYHPAWIVLRVLPGSSDAAVRERRAFAEEIAQKARSGEDFADLARRYSDDSLTRAAGGDLGLRAPQGSQAALAGKRETMDEALEAVLMTLDEEQVASPVRAGDAFVVMKLLSRQPSRYTTLEAAESEMLTRLQTEVLEKAKRKWLEELKRRTHVDVRL